MMKKRNGQHPNFLGLARPELIIHRVGDIPLRRIGTPTDAGRAILAAVSPLFSYVSGQVS